MLYLATLLPLLALSSASPAPAAAAAASITQHRRINDLVKIKSTTGDKCLSMAPMGEVMGYGFENLETPVLHIKNCSLADQWVLTPNAIGTISRKDEKAKVLKSMGANAKYVELEDLAAEIKDDQKWLYDETGKKLVLNPNPDGSTDGKQCLGMTQFLVEVPPTVEQLEAYDRADGSYVEVQSVTETREAVETFPCGATKDLVTGNTFEQGWEIIH